MHPGIADPVVGAFLNGPSPHMQIEDLTWNHGEGFVGINHEDRGGWFENDDGTGVVGSDIHSPNGWVSANWVQPYLPPGAIHPMDHMVGYLRPDTLALETWHPRYGNVAPYVDQAAFELFRPESPYNPAQHTHVVIVIYNWETMSFPADANGDTFTWRQIYPGFFSPDGLIRREAGATAASFQSNVGYDASIVQRPPGHSQLVREFDAQTSTWYPVVGYIVPSVTKRQTDLNEQRNMQLLHAVKTLLSEASSRNPVGELNAMTATEIRDKVVVVFSGGSNGGLQSKWSLLRYPDKIHGAECQFINPSMQRMFGEHDLGYATGMLSGGSDAGAGIEGADFMHWGRYAWNQGYWVHDLSYLRRFEMSEAYRPACFMCGDEDITSTGTDWAALASGAGWSDSGLRQQSGSGTAWSIGNEIGWVVAATACHGNIAEVHNPYAGGSATQFYGDLTRGVVERAIAYRQLELSASPPLVITKPPARPRTSSLFGLDDPHEWALGRPGAAMPDHSSDPQLRRDDDWFHAVQPGAAGTHLGQKEAMLIADYKVYVVGAEGVVTSFEVDPTSTQGSLRKVAHSNDGTTTAGGIVLPMSLGHDGTGMTIVTNGSSSSLVVATRRHLHRLHLDTLEILQSVEVPWEVARPHHLTVGSVLPQQPPQLIYASMHGGLVFYKTDLTPIYEWPEPGIHDFLVQGDKVTILSERGVVADVKFQLGTGVMPFDAELHAVSRPIPRQMTLLGQMAPTVKDIPCQGIPWDLELFRANWAAAGAGTVVAPIALWSGDTDGLGVRLYIPPTMASFQFHSDTTAQGGGVIATCSESSGYAPGTPGDHLLLLNGGRLSLYDQTGNMLGEKVLNLATSPVGGPAGYYPPGNQVHALAVGELVVDASQSYSQEVVIAGQSGNLMWMHIDEVLGPSGPLKSDFYPAAANQGATPTAVLPRSNQSMTATWAIAERNDGQDNLHLLDQRGGYWRVGASGVPTYWEGTVLATQMRGWDDLEHLDANGDPLGFGSLVLPEDVAIQQIPGLAKIFSYPWCPANVHQLANLQASTSAANWFKYPAGTTLFEGFMAHRWGGDVADVVAGAGMNREAFFWSARPEQDAVTNPTGPWGNLVEGLRFPLPRPPGVWRLSARWASTEYVHNASPPPVAGEVALDFLPLRSFVSNVSSMTHQSVAAEQLPLGPVRLVFGCPGGKVRIGTPEMGVGGPGNGHQLGPVADLVEDLGFGGAALATKVVAPSTIRIWFGTLYSPTPLPAAYGATPGALGNSEVATGGVHILEWSPGGVPTVIASRSLAPSMGDRGGYGIVGMFLADLLPETDSNGPVEDELIVTTLAGDIFVLDSSSLATDWRTHVPGAAGYYNSVRVSDLDGDGSPELYVCGSLGVWRFVPPSL